LGNFRTNREKRKEGHQGLLETKKGVGKSGGFGDGREKKERHHPCVKRMGRQGRKQVFRLGGVLVGGAGVAEQGRNKRRRNKFSATGMVPKQLRTKCIT